VTRKTFASTLCLLFAALALCASIIAAATLPDQSSLGGFYDAADEDDVLLLVWEQCPGLPPTVIVPATPEPVDAIAAIGQPIAADPRLVLSLARPPPLS
jgi:hypothetical protein